VTDVEPFAVLGLDQDATLDDVRAARRRLAFELHPDRTAGDPVAARRMQEVNVAFDRAVRLILRRGEGPTVSAASAPSASASSRSSPPSPPSTSGGRRVGSVWSDVASFTIECAPAEAFERLFVVSHWVGEPLHADPPDILEVHLKEPTPCYCRFELMPEGAATMVSIIVGTIEPWMTTIPPTDVVRDLFVALVNQFGAGDEYRDSTR
jgi:hypothetical protein